MKRSAHARWEHGLKDGRGYLTTDSRTLDMAGYSFPTRFGDEVGTNPEELIAAAHAGCFSMALAFYLGNAGTPPDFIETTAELSIDMGAAAGPSVTGIHLRVSARVAGIEGAAFQSVAMQAKKGCLVSRLLNTTITLDAVLV